MSISEKIARKAIQVECSSLSNDVVDRVKYLLLDYLGVAARGARTESSEAVHSMLSQNADQSRGMQVIGTMLRAEASYAALANGVAAHALELDDVVNAASLHPAVCVMPAALSMGHLVGATGKDLITAIVLGYEVMVKLGVSLDPAALYTRGFHPTGTCGVFGAALASGKLAKLGEAQMVNAMGIAGSQAAGLLEFLFDGTSTKPFHAGWSAHSGLVSTLLARGGFTGPRTVIEGKLGFLHAYSDNSDQEKILDSWGEPYEVMRTSIKPHACCRYKQASIDCIQAIMMENSLTPEDIDKVVLSILKAGFALIVDPWEKKLNPKTIVDAQFSMAYGAAITIVYGRAFLDEYSIDNINSNRILKMMQRIECVEDDNIENDYPQKWPAKAVIFTKDGRRLETRVEYPKGDPENPLTWEELIDKFKLLTAPVFSSEQINNIVTYIRNLEHEEDLSYLLALTEENRGKRN